MKKKIMIDLETLGTEPGAAILSIGAVQFTDAGLGHLFHERISLASCEAAGLKIQGATVLWWLDQSAEAREALLKSPVVDLACALSQLSAAFDWRGAEVWANGASFDFPLLKAAYAACALPVPWRFYQERDYRTLKHTVPAEVFDELEIAPRLAHDALEDAVAQAATAIQVQRYLDEAGAALQMIERAEAPGCGCGGCHAH